MLSVCTAQIATRPKHEPLWKVIMTSPALVLPPYGDILIIWGTFFMLPSIIAKALIDDNFLFDPFFRWSFGRAIPTSIQFWKQHLQLFFTDLMPFPRLELHKQKRGSLVRWVMLLMCVGVLRHCCNLMHDSSHATQALFSWVSSHFHFQVFTK